MLYAFYQDKTLITSLKWRRCHSRKLQHGYSAAAFTVADKNIKECKGLTQSCSSVPKSFSLRLFYSHTAYILTQSTGTYVAEEQPRVQFGCHSQPHTSPEVLSKATFCFQPKSRIPVPSNPTHAFQEKWQPVLVLRENCLVLFDNLNCADL